MEDVNGGGFSLPVLFDVFLLRLLDYLLLVVLLLELLESCPFEHFLLSLYENVFGNVAGAELVLTDCRRGWANSLRGYAEDGHSFELLTCLG